MVPRCTYTTPEVAAAGLDEVALQQGGIDFDVWRAEISHNDRAILEGEEHGFCKVLTRRGTAEILGATVVAGAIA
eukprot:SAG31_NODE_11588_length_1015_cov_1.360262_1_plen_75_part_00